jgi:hypothetical protein
MIYIIILIFLEALTSESSNISHGTTNTASNIKNLGVFLHVSAKSQVELLTLKSLSVGLALELLGEVEVLSPSLLVEVGGQVVVVDNDVLVVLVTLFGAELAIVMKISVLGDVGFNVRVFLLVTVAFRDRNQRHIVDS